jgi:hypothetical protein
VNVALLAAIAYTVLNLGGYVGGTSTADVEGRVERLEGQVDALREELRERDE